MAKVELSRLTWSEAQDAFRRNPVILLPMGSVEQHGPHVPVGDYQMFMDGTGLPWPDPDFYTSFFSSNGASYAKPVGFADAKLDQLLDEGRTTIDQAKRKAIYAQVEQRIVDLAPWVWINWRPQAEAAVASVQGFFQLPGALAGRSLMNLKYVWKE